jgi:hypothetical protein
MTYVDEGRQYIVVPIGGREEPPEWIALALPDTPTQGGLPPGPGSGAEPK